MKRILLSISGMTCSACSNGLEKYLNKQNGILNASVNLVMANVTIDYDETILTQERIEHHIKQAGFESLGLFQPFSIVQQRKKEKIQFVVFSLFALLLLYISMGHMIHLPMFPLFDPHQNPIGYTIILLFLTILFLFYGYDILKSGFKNLIHLVPNMDTLVSIGVISSFLYSIYGMYRVINGEYSYTMNLYFESSAIVIYFIKLGRYFDKISKDKTKEAIEKLVKLTPNTAIIELDGEEKIVTLDEIHKNDIVIAKPGDKIAVDGEIIEGQAHFDDSFITGESKSIMKQVGSKVIAGSLNYDGFIKYKALKIGNESTISEIVKLVIEASNTKAPIARVADRISGYFVPIIIVIAVLTFVSYLLLGESVASAIDTFVTILVVACPCSLGLATPLAIVVSEGLCASNGILVKKSEVLENASKIQTIVFDKTGTLTYGTLKISRIFNYSELDEIELLQLVASLESKSTHPIGKAFTDYIKERQIKPLEVSEFETIPGYGIVGKIQNQIVRLGNQKMVLSEKIPNSHREEEDELAKQGNSIIYVIRNQEIIGLIGVNDVIRDNAKSVIRELNAQNIDTIMLTGDNEKTAQIVGSELKISKVIANVLPSEKATMIKQLKQEKQYVMMCGDGINDSPALASSDIGVSVKSGTDIAMDSADVILIHNDLQSIVKLIHISNQTVKNIKQNLFWAFFYNSFMIPIAIGFFKPLGISINPMIASIAMVLSSLTVIGNALRLKKVK